MSAVTDAMDALVAAIKTVPKLYGYRADQLGKVQLPAGIVGLPSLDWTSYCTDPNQGAFPVTLVARLGAGVVDFLTATIGPFAEALETTGGVVDSNSGATPLEVDFGEGLIGAGYQVIVQYPLNS
jgi:hypothetical protein